MSQNTVNQNNVPQAPELDQYAGGDGIQILNKLTANDWGSFFRRGEREDHKHDTVILSQGQLGSAVYFILDGEVRVEQMDDEKVVKLARLGPGSVFGEMSFLDSAPVSANVIADGTVGVLKITSDILDELLRDEEGFGTRFYYSLALTLSRRLRATNKLL